MSEAKQATAWEWWGDYLFEGHECILAPEHDGSLNWTDEDRVKQLIKAAPKLLAACKAVVEHCRGCSIDVQSPEWLAIYQQLKEAICEAKGGL